MCSCSRTVFCPQDDKSSRSTPWRTNWRVKADMKTRQVASQQTASTPLRGVRKNLPRGAGRTSSVFIYSFVLFPPRKGLSADKCRRTKSVRERPRDLERVRDNDKRGCFSPKTAMTHPITHPDSLRPGYNPGLGKSSVTVVTGHMREGKRVCVCV